MYKPKNIWRINFVSAWRENSALGDLNGVNQFHFFYREKSPATCWWMAICWWMIDNPGHQKPGNNGFHVTEPTSKMMDDGDLVWTRNRDGGRLYLGKIEGSWDPTREKQHAVGMFNIRPCKFHEVRPADCGENHTKFFSDINMLFVFDCVQQSVTDEKITRRTMGQSTSEQRAGEQRIIEQRTIEIWDKIKPNR